MSAICDAHKKKVDVDVEQLYNSLHRKFNQFGDQTSLKIRPVGDKMQLRKPIAREAGPPGPRLSSPEERKRNVVMANRVGVNMLQFCSVSNSLSHTTLSNKLRGIFFKRTVSLVFIVCRCVLHADIYVLCSYTTHTWIHKEHTKTTFHDEMNVNLESGIKSGQRLKLEEEFSWTTPSRRWYSLLQWCHLLTYLIYLLYLDYIKIFVKNKLNRRHICINFTDEAW